MNKDHKINNTDKDNQNEPTSTTGHDWDGISEYDIPAPRWWLTVWVICIIWAVIYWFFYPAWPIKNGNSKGLLNWSTKSDLLAKQNIANVEKSKYIEQIDSMSFNEIKNNPQLMEFALNGGKASFKENCAGCHGNGAQGAKGYPNLNDDDWLWGGKIEDIYTTLLYGIRSGHEKARVNQMPYFGKDKILTKKEIEQVAEYVIALSDKENQHNFQEGEAIFKANCVSCHSNQGSGNRAMGAPRLNDKIWLYGGDKKDVIYTIHNARAGVMPYWNSRLDNVTIKQLSLFVHSLGGGE